MQINIYDPGINRLAGHHIDHCLKLTRALAKMGHQIDIHGFRDCDPVVETTLSSAQVRYHRSFSNHAYALPEEDHRTLDGWRQMSRSILQDAQNIPAGELNLWITMTPTQCLAIAQLEPRPRTICALDGHINNMSLLWPEILAEGAQLMARRAPSTVLFAYDEFVARCYAPYLTPMPVHLAPAPFDGGRPSSRTKTLKTVGFFGTLRNERGAEHLPALVNIALRLGLDVIVQDSSGMISEANSHPRVKLLKFVEDFASAMDGCDLMIWPGNPNRYLNRPSGVTWQAIALGIPVLAPAGCVPAQILASKGGGIYYYSPNVDSIANGLKRAIDTYPELLERAEAGAKRWAQTEGIERLAAQIVNPTFTRVV